MPVKVVTADDVTAAQRTRDAAQADYQAAAATITEAIAAGRQAEPGDERALVRARGRVEIARLELDQRRTEHQAWLDDQASRPGREAAAAADIRAADADIDTIAARIAHAAAAAQTALVELLDAGKAYDQAIQRASAMLLTHGLTVHPNDDHQTGADPSTRVNQTIRITGQWHYGLNDPALLIEWVLARVADARLPRHHPMQLRAGPHRHLEARSARLFAGVPQVPVDPTVPPPLHVRMPEFQRPPVGVSGEDKRRRSRR